MPKAKKTAPKKDHTKTKQLVQLLRGKGAPEYDAIAEILLAVTGCDEPSTSPAQQLPG